MSINYDKIVSDVLQTGAIEAPPQLLQGVRAGISAIDAKRAAKPSPWKLYRLAPVALCLIVVGVFGYSALMRNYAPKTDMMEYAYSMIADVDEAYPVLADIDAVDVNIKFDAPSSFSNAVVEERGELERSEADTADVMNSQYLAAATPAPGSRVSTFAMAANAMPNAGREIPQYVITGPRPKLLLSLSGTATADGAVFYERVPAMIVDDECEDPELLVSVLWIP